MLRKWYKELLLKYKYRNIILEPTRYSDGTIFIRKRVLHKGFQLLEQYVTDNKTIYLHITYIDIKH